MKSFLVLVLVLSSISAARIYRPRRLFRSTGAPNYGSYGPSTSPSTNHETGRIFRHIDVYEAPQFPGDNVGNVLQIPNKSEKRVNIIFVKALSSAGDKPTELILPQPEQHKALVYILVKKFNPLDNLNITMPTPTRPSSQVYFIRYKSPDQGSSPNGTDSSTESAQVPSSVSLGTPLASSPKYETT